MKLAIIAAMLAANCQNPIVQNPDPTPIEIPDEPAASAADCQASYEHLQEMECPPAEWNCAALTPKQAACISETDICRVARECLQ